MISVILIGGIASGKSTALRVLQQCLGQAFVRSMSTIIKEEANRRGVHLVSRDDYTTFANSIRKNNITYFAELIVCEYIGAYPIIIDGVRHPIELEYLTDKLQNPVTIGIYADFELRAKRVIARSREIDPLASQDVMRILEDELNSKIPHGLQVGKCLEACDILVNGNQNIEDFSLAIRKILKEVINVRH